MIYKYVERGRSYVRVHDLESMVDKSLIERHPVADKHDNVLYQRRRRKRYTPYVVNRMLMEFGHCLEGATCRVPTFYARYDPAELTADIVFGKAPQMEENKLNWEQWNRLYRERRVDRKLPSTKHTGQLVQSLGGRLV